MKYWTLAVLVIGTASLLSCRSRSQSAKEASTSVSLIVTLKNIDEVDRAKVAGLLPQASCNGGAFIDGSHESYASSEVRFPIAKLQKGDACQVRLLDPQLSDDMIFLKDEKVTYATDGTFEVDVRAGGELWAEALLRRGYKLKDGPASLDIKVSFGTALPTRTDQLVAEIKCSPEFEGVAVGLQEVDATKASGVLNFRSGLKPDQSYVCHQVQVTIGKNLFYGSIDETFTGTAGQKVVAKKAVELNEVEINQVSGVVIITTPGEACKPGEFFDLETRKCKAMEQK